MKFHEMEEKLKREKEKENEASGSKVQDVAENHNQTEDELQRPASIDVADSLPGPVQVPSYDGPTQISVEVPSAFESTESNSIAVSDVPAAVPSQHPVTELPPISHTIEQERLELIEINNDGTSGHLTHSIEK